MKAASTVTRVAGRASSGRMYKVSMGSHVEVYPSVTSVLSVLEKAALVPWAVRTSLEVVRRALSGQAAAGCPDLLPPPQATAAPPAPDAPAAPSSSWIESLIKRASAAPDEIKIASATFGTRTHAAIDAIIAGRPPSGPLAADIAPAVEGFRRWYAASGIILCPAGDTPVFSRTYRYAGACDCLGYRPATGALVVLDFKTSNFIHTSYALQLAAYAHAAREMWASGELDVEGLVMGGRARAAGAEGAAGAGAGASAEAGVAAGSAAPPAAASPARRRRAPQVAEDSGDSLRAQPEGWGGGGQGLAGLAGGQGAAGGWGGGSFGLAGLGGGLEAPAFAGAPWGALGPGLEAPAFTGAPWGALGTGDAQASSVDSRASAGAQPSQGGPQAAADGARSMHTPQEPQAAAASPVRARARRSSASGGSGAGASGSSAPASAAPLTGPIVSEAALLSLTGLVADSPPCAAAGASAGRGGALAAPSHATRSFSTSAGALPEAPPGQAEAPASEPVAPAPEAAPPQEQASPPLPLFSPREGPDGVPMEALIVRLDKATGAAEVKHVVDLEAAFGAFKAALLLWHAVGAGAAAGGHELLAAGPAGVQAVVGLEQPLRTAP